MSTKTKKRISQTVFYVLLVAVTIVMLYPLVFMVLAGLFTAEEYNMTAIGIFPIPKHPTLKNFGAIFGMSSYLNITTYALNSVLRTVIATVSTVVTTGICGYVFSRLDFPFRKGMFLVLLLISMLPGTITILPTFLLYRNTFEIYDTWWVYLATCPAINVMGTFVVRQYFDTMPKALDESAKIDGCSHFGILFRIILPVAKPIFAYIAITTAIGTWNDWFTPFFYTESPEIQMLPSAIAQISIKLTNGVGLPDYPLLITLSLAVTLPALIIYMVFQRYIVEGLAYVGIKG